MTKREENNIEELLKDENLESDSKEYSLLESSRDSDIDFEEVPKILVVDDESIIREILADFLTMEGYIVRTAADGVSALEELEKDHYDMVISDLKMPRMNGLELLDEIQKRYDNVLTVIMTGYGTVETAIEAMKKGAYDYILKPFKIEEVIHIVQRGLEKRRLISENIKLKEIISLYKLSEAISSSLSLEEILNSVIETILKEISPDAIQILWQEEDRGFIELRSAINPKSDVKTLGDLDLDAVIEVFNKKKYILAHGPAIQNYFVQFPENLNSFISIPLKSRQKIMGIINAFCFQTGRKFREGERKLLSIIAGRIATAIENAKLYRNIQESFRQTIQALARALEAMDKYTAGHSDRVTEYARITAEEMGLPEEEIELIKQAGLMHDIGKLGCHTNLNKPGKLTEEEYEIFKKHPEYGKQILEPIPFLHPLIPGVYLHHERWDGKGYPLGLKGEEIPLMARILAVADAYDAMTSNRAYRKALKHSVAIAELKRCSGTQFDPKVVEAFLRAIEKWRKEKIEKGEKVPE